MTLDRLVQINEESALVLDPSGEAIGDEHAATDLIGDAIQSDARMVIVPVERLTGDFFDLRTGIAGQIVNKFAVYRLRLVILGDITQLEERSKSFRDFVREVNRGTQVWFASTWDELDERLKVGG